jgi:hypothetical protein
MVTRLLSYYLPRIFQLGSKKRRFSWSKRPWDEGMLSRGNGLIAAVCGHRKLPAVLGLEPMTKRTRQVLLPVEIEKLHPIGTPLQRPWR